MKKLISIAVLTLAAACGGSSNNNVTTGLTTSAAINAYLEGKTMVMTGNDIPTFPEGYSQDVNLGSATQCFNKTTIAVASGTWNVTTLLGTLNGASSVGATGMCDRTTVSGSPETFSSTAVGISNVQGDATCFDVDVTYSGFAQEGRGSISADGKTVTLELYFSGQAAHDRCADGAVGSAGVTVTPSGGTATSVAAGTADQIYVIQ